MLTNKKKGFTLVEIIVVLVIIAILAAISLPALTGYIKEARINKVEMAIADIRKAFIAAAANVDITKLPGGLIIPAVKGEAMNSDEKLFAEKIQRYLSDYVIKTDPKNPDYKYSLYFYGYVDGGITNVEDLLATVTIYYYPNGMKHNEEMYSYVDGVLTQL